MKQLVDQTLVPKILKLNLPFRLICDGNKAFPMLIKSKRGTDGYVVAIGLGERDIRQFHTIEIELKGRIDVEYLKYRGEVEIKPLLDEPGHYIMKNIRLYKYNQRSYKRVPYRRLIQITQPTPMEATLINLSAAGALIYSKEIISEDEFEFSIVLNKKTIYLTSKIVEQTYNESLEMFMIRCEFIKLDEKTKKLLLLTVREIIFQAKLRLQQI